MIEPSATSSETSLESPLLLGHNPDSVIEAIRERHLRRATGDGKPDGHRIALILEGGGMRAAGAAGGALALGHLGLKDVFDDIYTTSAAVMNASYFLTGQEDMGITIYFDDLSDERFCDYRRFWKILDVDYAIHDVVKDRKPLDVAKLLNSPTRLHTAVMDHQSGAPHAMEVKGSEEEALHILKAALSIPVFYGRTQEIGGRRYMDGGLLQPFPIQAALNDGATHVLVFLTQPSDFLHPAPRLWQKLVFQILCSQGRNDVYSAYRDHHIVSRESRELVLGQTDLNLQNSSIATLCPREEPFITTMTKDRKRLVAAACAYGRMTIRAFGLDPGDWELGPRETLSWDQKTTGQSLN